jgi:hypothetical protein
VRAALRRAFTPTQVARLAGDLRLAADAPPSALSFDQWLGLFRAWRLFTGPASSGAR